MAEFAQSAASRAALHDAARQHLNQQILSSPAKALAAQIGVSERTVQRWKAFLTGSGSQARNPAKSLPKVAKAAKPVQVTLKADFDYGGDPAYHRDQKPMHTMGDGLGADFFAQALNNPDEAWEMFLDNYGVVGTVENVRDIRFS